MDNHHANIHTKNLTIPVHIVHKYQFHGIPFTFINSLYNYQVLGVLFVVSCAEILYISTMKVLPQFSLIGKLEISKLLKLVIVSNI